MRRHAIAVVGLLATLAGATFASSASASASELQWNDEWPTFRTSEAVVTGAAGAGFAAFYLFPSRQPTWGRPILFDAAVRDAFLSNDAGKQEQWQHASTAAYLTMLGYPILVDALVVPLARGSLRVSAQVFLIDLEAFAISGLVYRVSESLIRRSRPVEYACAQQQGGSFDGCRHDGLGATNSFISGHVAIASTGAALTCVHHLKLGLYGSPGDELACAAGIATTALVAVGRLVTDNHYATDVLSGAVVGTLSGLLIPMLLHYDARLPAVGLPVPQVTSASLGLGWVAAF